MWPHFLLKWAVVSILEGLFLIAPGSQGNMSVLLPATQKYTNMVISHTGDSSAECNPGTPEL